MSATTAFRFGAVATPHGGGEQWLATSRRVAELGYSTLLMPDGLQLPAPMPALALAAGAVDIRVGTWVLAAPLRPARTTAWEAHSLSALTGGRFELGIGTGRPIAEQWTREIGLPYGTSGQRLESIRQTVDHLRQLDGDGPRTPVLMAVAGPRARAFAAEHADIIALAVGALVSRDEVGGMLADVRAHAGARADDLEIATSLFVVGDVVPPHAQRYIGANLAQLTGADSLALLSGTAREMADELERRRERYGMSYVTVSAEYLEPLAPVVELLTGR
jgi:probable F420-dependent oxidoreductase